MASPLQGNQNSMASLLPLLMMLQAQGGNRGPAGQPLPNAAPSFNSGTGGAGGATQAPTITGPGNPAPPIDNSAALIKALMRSQGNSGGGKGGGKSGSGLGGILGSLGGSAGKGAAAGAGAMTDGEIAAIAAGSLL